MNVTTCLHQQFPIVIKEEEGLPHCSFEARKVNNEINLMNE
jgi:hypothetical protein